MGEVQTIETRVTQAEESKNGEMMAVEPSNTLAREERPTLSGWKAEFVISLADTPIVALACKSAGVSRFTAYRHRDLDEVFREAWDHALEDGWDGIEEKAVEFARGGSERLIELLLKGNKAKTYRDTHGPLVNIQLPPVTEALQAALASPAMADFARRLTEKAADSRDGQ